MGPILGRDLGTDKISWHAGGGHATASTGSTPIATPWGVAHEWASATRSEVVAVRRPFVQVAPLHGPRKRRPKICASMTWETFTPESVAEGESDESGFEFKNRPYASIRDLAADPDIDYKGWVEWSSSPAGPDDWIVGEGETDMYSGVETRYSLHPKHCDGGPLTHGETWYLTRRLLGRNGRILDKSIFDEARRYHQLHRSQRWLP